VLRRIRTILCGLSLLLCLALLILWPLSRTTPIGLYYRHTETAPFTFPAPGKYETPHFYFGTIQGGKIAIGHWRQPIVMQSMKKDLNQIEKQLAALRPQLEEETAHPDAHRKSVRQDYQKLSQTFAEYNGRFFRPDGLHTGPDPFNLWKIDDPYFKRPFPGVSYWNQTDLRTARIEHHWHIHLWLIVILLLIAPLFRGLSLYRAFLRRRRSNHCPSCGYDLRATPTLCPECGHITDAALSQ
jgi:hypothetical protein